MKKVVSQCGQLHPALWRQHGVGERELHSDELAIGCSLAGFQAPQSELQGPLSRMMSHGAGPCIAL